MQGHIPAQFGRIIRQCGRLALAGIRRRLLHLVVRLARRVAALLRTPLRRTIYPSRRLLAVVLAAGAAAMTAFAVGPLAGATDLGGATGAAGAERAVAMKRLGRCRRRLRRHGFGARADAGNVEAFAVCAAVGALVAFDLMVSGIHGERWTYLAGAACSTAWR